MARKPLVTILKQMVRDQTTSIGVVGNLLGSQSPIGEEIENLRSSEWKIYYLNDAVQLSPDQVVRRLSPSEQLLAPVVMGLNGVIEFIPSYDGLYLYSTLIEAPDAFAVPVSVSAKGSQISVYLDESLVRRGADRVQATVNIPKGIYPLNVIVIGASTRTTITIPEDVRAFFQQHVPSAPEWRSPIPIETNYIDPKTGSTGNGLFWKSSAKAGGWGVYKINKTSYGMIVGAELIPNRHYFLTVSGTYSPPINALISADTNILGYLTEFFIDSGNSETVFKVYPTSYFEPALDILSGTLYTNGFVHLTDIAKSTGESYISFTDTNVKAGDSYSYSLDAYAVFDASLRSAKSEIKTVVAGDVTPPDAISITEFVVDSNIAYVRFHTPTDEDYLGVKVYYNNVSSGTVDNLITDFGLPDLNDQLNFRVVDSGTYYFRSVDIVGNEQVIVSGASYAWNGVQIGGTVDNLPPTVSIRMLSSAETTTDGYDPVLFCRFELDADDPEDVTPTVDYRTRDQSPGSWLTAGALPYKVNVTRKDRDNWLQARAYDGELYSDVMMVVSDFDTRPEVVSAFGRVDIESNTVVANGTVDDDTGSLRWEVHNITWNGTLLDSGVVTDLSSTKTFELSFSLPDGSRRVLSIWPHSEQNLGGYAGIPNRSTYEIPPRTRATVMERNAGGAVTRGEVLISLTAEPPTSTIYMRLDPVQQGIATGYSGTVLSDNLKAGIWTDDQFNVDYEVILDSGTGAGQVRDITDTIGATGQLTISPAWSTNPDSTTGYRIRENFTTYTSARVVVRDPLADTRLDFYSELEIDTGVYLTETVQGIVIDNDTIPEILSGSVVETDINVISVTIIGIDEDVKIWELFARKNSWPTKTGAQSGEPSIDYLKSKKSTSDSTVTFHAFNGEWHLIIRPSDSYSNYGPNLYLTIPIDVSSYSGSPAITSTGVEVHDSPTFDYNRIHWFHNSDAEKPGGGNGTVTVKVFARRSDMDPSEEEEITTPATRYAWQDSEDGNSYSNTDDTSNSISGYGSMLHTVNRGSKPDWSWQTWYYKIELYDSSSLVGIYYAEHSGYYGPAR